MKKHIVILFLLLGAQLGYAQTQVTLLDKPAFYLSAEGILLSQIQKSIGKDHGKTNHIYLAGGFINVRPIDYKLGTVIRFSKQRSAADIDLLRYSRNAKLYYHTYFAASNGQTMPAPVNKPLKLWLQDQKTSTAYLRVNDVFNVDILDYQTDTLVKRYSIKRIRVFPSISFNAIVGKKGKNIPVSENKQLAVASSDKIEVRAANNNDLRYQPLDYTLTNLKTGKQERFLGRRTIQLPKLTANTDYELRCNFDIQPESTLSYHIQVKAKWYQLPLVYGLAVGLLILFMAIAVIWRLKGEVKRSQKKQKEIEQSILRLQSQLNPHFTFNALSSIQGLMNTNRIAEANDYLQDFSSLLRKTLSKGQQIFNTLDQELEMMQTYIRLEALRYNFTWEIQLSLSCNASIIEIPTLLLQPLIENAIKHGIASLGSKGLLLISCHTNDQDDSLRISISDNGQWTNANSHMGYGLQLTYDRISAINKLPQEKKIVLNFEKQQGTVAIFTFQNWINQ